MYARVQAFFDCVRCLATHAVEERRHVLHPSTASAASGGLRSGCFAAYIWNRWRIFEDVDIAVRVRYTRRYA